MKNICIVQPLIANYRIPLFDDLEKYWRLTVVYSPVAKQQGFGDQSIATISGVNCREIPTCSPLGQRFGMYQSGIIRTLQKIHPDAVITFANLRYLSFWTTLIWCKIHGIPVFPHGHGLYRKHNPGFLWKMIYRVVLWLSTAYICYTPSVAESLLRLGLSKRKIVVAENSLVNPCPVSPGEKTAKETGILFIGRLRSGSRLDLLISAVAQLHVSGYPSITLHIIGDGPDAQRIRNLAMNMPWVRFHGSVYASEKLSEISRDCMAGCYPGNAGLSIVHFMSLSLPPIVHDDMAAHGPEPSYIKSGENGLLFDHLNPEAGLLSALIYMLEEPKELKRMQAKAYATYEQIAKPSLAMRIINIVGE